jgi:hypothetical protein
MWTVERKVGAAMPVFKPQCRNLWTELIAAGLREGTLFDMRALLVLSLCSTLAACSHSEDLSPIKPYVPPSMPTMAAANKGIGQAATEEKVVGPIEMSDLRESDHGPGRFMLCIRGVEPKYKRVTTYAVFFDNDDYKGTRMSVMIDDCEKQAYRPCEGKPLATPPNSAPAPPTGRHHRNHQRPF